MQIYGIDVSKGHLDVYTVNAEGKATEFRLNNNFRVITKFLGALEPEDVICAEHTGIYGQVLQYLACAMEVRIALCSGYTIKHSLGNQKGKSDTLDAKRIWEYGHRFFDQLEWVKPESEVMTEIRELFNLRNLLAKNLKALTTSIKSSHQLMNSIVLNEIRERSIKQLEQEVKNVEEQILALIRQNPELEKNYQLVTSIPGIGPITAIELIVDTGNFKQIDTARKAAAYAGVCPYPNQSGNISRKQKVHFRSNKRLKSLMYMCSKTICLHNKEFKLYRERKMLEGKHYFLVMNNVANKLLRIIYSLIASGEQFDLNYVHLNPREKN